VLQRIARNAKIAKESKLKLSPQFVFNFGSLDISVIPAIQ